MLNDREKILSALREKPQKVFEVMKRANIPNQEACQSLLLKMRDEGSVKFDIHKANGSSPDPGACGIEILARLFQRRKVRLATEGFLRSDLSARSQMSCKRRGVQ
jgi:hypothetical protein